MKRRTFLTTGLVGLAGLRVARAQPRFCTLTAADIEGPFFRPGAPRRTSMVHNPDSIRLHGVVMDRRCAPVPDARIELWQANAQGQYDLEGFAYRACVTSDAAGRWQIETIVPGRYLNGPTYRPAHIHAKVITAGRTLTTQLYFPGDPFNANDPWFDAARRVQMHAAEARFDFVV